MTGDQASIPSFFFFYFYTNNYCLYINDRKVFFSTTKKGKLLEALKRHLQLESYKVFIEGLMNQDMANLINSSKDNHFFWNLILSLQSLFFLTLFRSNKTSYSASPEIPVFLSSCLFINWATFIFSCDFYSLPS